MDGYETCRRLREMYASNMLPIILVTARNRVSDVVRGDNVVFTMRPPLLLMIRHHAQVSKPEQTTT